LGKRAGARLVGRLGLHDVQVARERQVLLAQAHVGADLAQLALQLLVRHRGRALLKVEHLRRRAACRARRRPAPRPARAAGAARELMSAPARRAHPAFPPEEPLLFLLLLGLLLLLLYLRALQSSACACVQQEGTSNEFGRARRARAAAGAHHALAPEQVRQLLLHERVRARGHRLRHQRLRPRAGRPPRLVRDGREAHTRGEALGAVQPRRVASTSQRTCFAGEPRRKEPALKL
jgi:hypothetical protein